MSNEKRWGRALEGGREKNTPKILLKPHDTNVVLAPVRFARVLWVLTKVVPNVKDDDRGGMGGGKGTENQGMLTSSLSIRAGSNS